MINDKGPLYCDEALDKVALGLTVLWSACLTDLLTHKHLYQKASFNATDVTKLIAARVLKNHKDQFEADLPTLIEEHIAPGTSQIHVRPRNTQHPRPVPTLLVTNLKLFCSTCGQREAFAPIWYNDITNSMAEPVLVGGTSRPSSFRDQQLFVLIYQFQVCI
ncbi:MAG: hypothetical protein WB347_01865, partial [Terriglobales bacterium]